ncbi:MAG: hypothetical protein LBJ98_01290 [Endomicrobium sp.]|jgi:hypothetical protein|nr:hypothetical protein [Endomicrobium sp.]MDR2644959.1 hypothetical protein [Endomicrobium sp.]
MKRLVLAFVLSCSLGVGNVMSYYTVSDCERAKQQCSYYKSKCRMGNFNKVGKEVVSIFNSAGGEGDF